MRHAPVVCTRRRLVVLAAASLLTSCGFQPMYGRQNGRRPGFDAFSDVAVAPIPERTGQVIRNRLLDQINPYGEPGAARYTLGVTFQRNKVGIAFDRDQTITRYNLTLVASYVLTDNTSRAIVTRGSTRAVAAFNIVRSDFANIAAEQDAEERAALAVADDIALRLGAYFSDPNRRAG
jgi:LPS-assembly lipoprotein